MNDSSNTASEFDNFATSYDDALAEGLSVTGEDRNYYSLGRVRWLKRHLDRLKIKAEYAMEFGCGTGTNIPYLIEIIDLESLIGMDISESSLKIAKSFYGCEKVRFCVPSEFKLAGQVDLVFCNGVFHHIPVQYRASAIKYVRDSIKPGGLFAFWENNPWNPGTRYIMSKVSFDRDAILIGPSEGRKLLQTAGFEILNTSFLFIFPRLLRGLRFLEPVLSHLPLGGQYQMLARKPKSY